jgi:hypothetical protein
MPSSERLAYVAPPKVVLPVVARAVQHLDEVFIVHAGPSGRGLVKEIYKQWLAGGKTGPSALRHYVYALRAQLSSPAAQRQFNEEAEYLLLQLRSGFAN